jgi:hypothetical protein
MGTMLHRRSRLRPEVVDRGPNQTVAESGFADDRIDRLSSPWRAVSQRNLCSLIRRRTWDSDRADRQIPDRSDG